MSYALLSFAFILCMPQSHAQHSGQLACQRTAKPVTYTASCLQYHGIYAQDIAQCLLQQCLLTGFVSGCFDPELTVLCRYNKNVQDYNKAYAGAKAAIISKFYGPPTKGVYSPSVQYTLYQMAVEMLAK